MTPEPDRFEAKAREVWGALAFRSSAIGIGQIAAALRQAADDALERAAQQFEARTLSGSFSRFEVARDLRALVPPAAAPTAEDWRAADPADRFARDAPPSEPVAPSADLLNDCHAFLMALREWQPLAASALRHEVDALLIRFASPAAAPATGWKCDACGDELASESAQRRHEATWHGAAPAAVHCPHRKGNEPCEVCDSEPVAPSLLPRVLAELEAHRGMWSRGLAAELRRYIATDLRDKRIADLEATSESHRLGYVEALARAREHQRERDEANKRVAELETAIRWALGEEDEFTTRQPGQGAYWWRTELRRRAALADGGEGK